MEEDVEEVDKEMDIGEVPPIGVLAPEQALALLETLLVMAEIWVGGQGEQVAGPAVSLRAWDKAPAIQVEQPPPHKMDKELACRFQVEA